MNGQLNNENEETRLQFGDDVSYRFFRYVNTGGYEMRGGKRYPKQIKEYYSEMDVAQFRLDQHSKVLPGLDGNTVNIDLYFLRFWGKVFDVHGEGAKGSLVAYTYILIKSYCWNKNYAWISLTTLTEQVCCTKTTLKKYLGVLEKFGFISRFWREHDNNTQDTMLVKVRKTMPVISKQDYEALHITIRKEHDRILRDIHRETREQLYNETYDYAEVYEKLRDRVIDTKEVRVRTELLNLQMSTIEYEEALLQTTQQEEDIWNIVKKAIQKKVAPTMMELYFNLSILTISETNMWLIRAANDFQLDGLRRNENIIRETIHDLKLECRDICFDLY